MTGTDTVGVVGLGVMGLGIARRLLARDAAVIGFDVSADRLDEFVSLGGRTASTPGEVLAGAHVVLTCLPSATALAEVVSGFGSASPGPGIVVETSTLSVEAKHSARAALAAYGHTMLDAPISGTRVQLDTGDAILYASGGDAETHEVVGAALAGVFARILDLGSFGNGTTVKLIANHLVAVHNLAAAEAMLLADLAGMDLRTALRALTVGAGSSRMLEVRGPLMVDAAYEPAQMRFELFDKDLGLIREFADKVGASLGLFDAARERYTDALAAGFGASDTARLFELLQQEVRGASESGYSNSAMRASTSASTCTCSPEGGN
ncbi:oxidoreductase [Acrocarpospora pleiomorpha]|uniref:Oxidoreductase n=1 Tax=Acrocarpospora pleiomorpha TaxID=90975 RepID=A0A5M3Y518_9ACTN|nr:NAD(P)-dependent oxidoreductase [Acrocarpospora pleiomorpha]GES27071.1 oxidoreductase [Acrocarpospora pleiomorpha]